jgi:hypothetical protein
LCTNLNYHLTASIRASNGDPSLYTDLNYHLIASIRATNGDLPLYMNLNYHLTASIRTINGDVGLQKKQDRARDSIWARAILARLLNE